MSQNFALDIKEQLTSHDIPYNEPCPNQFTPVPNAGRPEVCPMHGHPPARHQGPAHAQCARVATPPTRLRRAS